MSINKNIFKSDNCSINLDTKSNTILVKSISTEYNKDEFQGFMEHLITFWEYAKIKGNKYYMLLDLRESEVSLMPMEFYTTLAASLNKINKIMTEHLHCTCILCKKGSKMDNILSLLFSLYNPKRPLKITADEDEVRDFCKENTL